MMNKYFVILAAALSFLGIEIVDDFIPSVWVRAAIYLTVVVIAVLYYEHRSNASLVRLNKHIQELVNGNYSIQPSKTKYHGTLKDTFDSILALQKKLQKYIFEIQVASSQVSSVSQQLNITLDENNAFAQQLYAESEEICSLNSKSQNNIVSIVNEIKNIVGLLENVKSTSEDMNNTSLQSKQVISSSLNEIMEIVESINDIQSSTDTTVQSIKKLNSATEEISHILETVDNISKQTHLLSLNASIESARAGEYGKGFGVVAEEIRKLSEDSKNAVSEIALLLKNMTAQVSGLTDKINDNLGQVQKSVAFSKNVENSLNKIQNSYQSVQEMIQKIISISEEEYVLASNINGQTSLLEDISEEVAAGFETVYDSVGKQKHNVEELGSLGTCLSGAAESLSSLIEIGNSNLLEDNLSKFEGVSQDVVQSLKKSVLSPDSFLSFDSHIHKAELDKVLDQNPSIEAIWSNDAKGRFIYSNPPAGIANANVRDWFKKSITGEEYVSQVYISAITKNPCVTVSLPIIDDSGKNIGVIGADLKLDI